MKKYVIQARRAFPVLYTCWTFYCLLHRVCLFIEHKSLEWRFYSGARVRLSMFSLSCQSAPPPPTPHMPELGERQTGQLNHIGLNVNAYPFILPRLSRNFEWAIVRKGGKCQKVHWSQRIPTHCFSRPPPFRTLSSISSWLYPCGIGLSPNRSDDTFEMQNGFQVNQSGLFSRLSATDNSLHCAPRVNNLN